MELSPVSCEKYKPQDLHAGLVHRKNGFFITVATGSTIKIKLPQLTLHAPPTIIKDCKQMPKCPHFLCWGTYGIVLDFNALCPVEGILYYIVPCRVQRVQVFLKQDVLLNLLQYFKTAL